MGTFTVNIIHLREPAIRQEPFGCASEFCAEERAPRLSQAQSLFTVAGNRTRASVFSSLNSGVEDLEDTILKSKQFS
jgi:hypothetical protein